MRELVAIVTMVKDDHFFLRRWVEYYGNLFGREALYVLSHGGAPEIANIAEGCNVIRIPPGYDEMFNSRRANTFSSFARALKFWFDFVIVTDVDEFLVIDPDSKVTLPEFLGRRKKDAMVITPIGVEVVHRPEVEPEEIGAAILGPRRYARYSSFYCKPIVIGKKSVKLSRGSHYASHPELKVFRNLYLFHMKYCDRAMSLETMDRRSKTIETFREGDTKQGQDLLTRWDKRNGREVEFLDEMANLPVREDWEFSGHIERMNKTWGERTHGLYDFARHEGSELYLIPERFHGII